MPKTRRHTTLLKSRTTMASIATPLLHGTWLHWNSYALRQSQHLQKEFRSRNLPLKGNKSVLSSCSTPDYIRRGSPSSNQGGTSMASSVTTTATLRHSNQTTCQTGASSETLRLLSSESQSLPQPQLTSLLIQAISANSPQTITPTSGTISGTAISLTTTSTAITASTQTTTCLNLCQLTLHSHKLIQMMEILKLLVIEPAVCCQPSPGRA